MAMLRITARNFLKVFLGNTFKKFLAWGLSTKLGHKPKRIIGGALRRQLFFWVDVLVLRSNPKQEIF